MTNRHQEIAEKAVEAFKELLSEQARQQISDRQFDELALIIREALSEELENAVEIAEDMVKRLRAQVERPELEL
ncbi:hypothetical protein Nhal_0355 [Nitrosococcus halophilus Nc 4]|uniref:Uncharacterized protein n=1 Tax=Nitrosococcus halophilus (strain Nc4) TaxID=472759 RepID=D5BVC2_NITHN|nr:hypothetical protein [Nitrosococcus halophilus]ADE13550.1 hypothetical protein Nhal_0355 [Nitrosococcus halophilus Nc 4]